MPSNGQAVIPCRHCGVAIEQRENGHHWVHAERPARHLYRCQSPERAYGYEAMPATNEACDCWACIRFGPTGIDLERTGFVTILVAPLTECHHDPANPVGANSAE